MLDERRRLNMAYDVVSYVVARVFAFVSLINAKIFAASQR